MQESMPQYGLLGPVYYRYKICLGTFIIYLPVSAVRCSGLCSGAFAG